MVDGDGGGKKKESGRGDVMKETVLLVKLEVAKYVFAAEKPRFLI